MPFVAGVEAGAEIVMTGHFRVPAISRDPASLSDDWISIARDELGFEGVIITDDLRMLKSSGEEAYSDLATVAVAALWSTSEHPWLSNCRENRNDSSHWPKWL